MVDIHLCVTTPALCITFIHLCFVEVTIAVMLFHFCLMSLLCLLLAALKKTNCDVVALQEVYEEWQADYLIESLRVTYPFTARRTSGSGLSMHNGLMLMSKFPILHTVFHPFRSVSFFL